MITRVGVFSDSHGDKRALSELLEKMGYLDAVCFLGDIASDADYLESQLLALPNHPRFYAVKGNNDWCDAPLSRIIVLGGVRIFMTHGHNQRVKSTMYYLQDAVRDAKCDVGLYGHTHCADIEMSTALLVNPGAACSDRCALLEIRDGKAHAKLLNYGFH